MHAQRVKRAAALGGAITLVFASACGTNETDNDIQPDAGPNFSTDGGDQVDDDPTPPMPTSFEVSLVPDGGAGMQRVNFAVPLSAGVLSDETKIAIKANGTDVPAARRALAKYAD